jgi:hypothetical protein
MLKIHHKKITTKEKENKEKACTLDESLLHLRQEHYQRVLNQCTEEQCDFSSANVTYRS